MRNIKVIIVDDESHGREVIRKLLNKYHTDFKIVDMADSVDTAVHSIKMNEPDIVFLDIELNGGSGFDVLNQIEEINFQVIFVTAFNHYAIRAIKYAALDYLLKPVDMFELKEALDKAVEKTGQNDNSSGHFSALKENMKPNGSDMIAIPSKSGFSFHKISEIIRCQAQSNYTEFHFINNKTLLVPRTLKDYDELLAGHNFCRVHGSHLVNMSHVRHYQKGKGGYVIMSDGAEIEVSIRKKESFLNKFLKL